MKRTFLLIILPFVSFNLDSQSSEHEKIDLLLEESMQLHGDSSHVVLATLEEILSLSQEVSYHYGIYQSYSSLGEYYYDLGTYDEAISYLLKAEEEAGLLDSTYLRPKTLIRIAAIHIELEQNNLAEEYTRKALNISQENNDMLGVGHAYNGLGIIAMRNRENEKALEHFEYSYAVFDSIGDQKMKTYPLNNFSYYYINMDDGHKALPYIKEALAIHRSTGNTKAIAGSHENLGNAYTMIGDYSNALKSFQICLDTAYKYNFNNLISITYRDMAYLHMTKGDYEESLDYYLRYSYLKDSINNDAMLQKIANLEVMYETAQKEKQLNANQAEIQQLEQQQVINLQHKYLLGIGITLALVIGGSIINKMRSDLKRKQELFSLEKKLADQKFKSEVLEKEKIQRELEYKSNYITNMALDISRRNKFLAQLTKGLTKLERSVPSESIRSVRELKSLTSSHLRINEDLDNIYKDVEELNIEFYQKLEQRYPELTPHERQLCGYIRLNLASKEIASIRNVSEKAIRMGRYRLRKKFKLHPNDDIVKFLNNFGDS